MQSSRVGSDWILPLGRAPRRPSGGCWQHGLLPLLGSLLLLAACTGAAPSAATSTASNAAVTGNQATATPTSSGTPATTAVLQTPSETTRKAATARPATQLPVVAAHTTTSSAAHPGANPSSADNWLTYGRTTTRGADDPASSAFGAIKQAWQSPRLDGDIYAEPLLDNGRLYLVTENDTVYSLDASSGKVQWQRHVGTPVPRSALPCGDIDPTGITGTPVIDQASSTLYAVAFLQPGKHELFALNLASGAVRYHVAIDPSGADPLVQQQRSALALANGMVYVAYGGLDGDCGQYHGWVVAAAANNGAPHATYQVPTQREGAVWAPAGPALDSAGNLYVATGNGSSTTQFDYGDSVIKLSPDLKVLDWFAPTNWAQLNRTDQDIGSISPLLLPNGLIFQIGKGGEGYLLRADHLGQIGGQAYAAPVCASGSGAFGSTAFATPYIYVPCRSGMVALKLGSGASFSTAWTGPTSAPDSPVVAGGVVWAVSPAQNALVGLDAPTGKARLQLALPAAGNGLPHFIAPTVAAGSVYIAAGRVVVAAR